MKKLIPNNLRAIFKDFHFIQIESNDKVFHGHDLPGFRCI